MKAAQLRQSILQAAVQGKLVPQNVHDEPASEFLERIRKEKTKLIKEDKIKKEKPLPPIAEDEIPYDLPDGWVWCRLGEIVSKVGAGSTPTGGRNVYTEEGIKFLRSQNVYDSGLVLHNVAFISESMHGKMKNSTVNPCDILLNITGASIGRCCIVPNEFDTANVNQHVSIIRAINADVRFFIHLYVISPILQKWIMDVQVGVSREGLSGEKIKSLVIPFPPLAEQQRIIAKIDELMALCDELEAAEKLLNKLEADFAEYLPKSILQAAVQGKLVPQNMHDEPATEHLERIRKEKAKLIKEGKIKKEKSLPPIVEDEIPYDLPDGWVWCRLGELGITQTGTTPAISKQVYLGEHIPFIKPADININNINYTNEGLSVQGLEFGRLIKFPAVMMVCIGGSIGKCFYTDRDVSCNQQINAITPYISASNKYIFYVLSAESTFEQIKRVAGGTATPIINKTQWILTLLPIPPLAEQQRIVAKVDELMALCQELKNFE